MESGMIKMAKIIDYIEENITSDIDCAELAAKTNLSVYEFRRIFAFVMGVPISEYIRKRRLSLAACEILYGGVRDILSLSMKYGYGSESAFVRAFGEQHGVSPTGLLKEKPEIKLFTRPRLEFSRSGGVNVPLRIEKASGFWISGYSEISDITDTCCCENVWNGFYEADTKISGNKIFAVYENRGENVKCTIGEPSECGDVYVPEALWACFSMNTVDDDEVNKCYCKILYEYLPSAKLKRDGAKPVVEIYPKNMDEDGFLWEIRIPIEKERKI